eukprot:357002-Chlamydomonas_euryale.AAC.10
MQAIHAQMAPSGAWHSEADAALRQDVTQQMCVGGRVGLLRCACVELRRLCARTLTFQHKIISCSRPVAQLRHL